MHAGQELDERIAVLMGWRQAEIDRVVGWAHPSQPTWVEKFYYWLGPNKENQLAPPPFSTSEEEALKVAEKLGLDLEKVGRDPLAICLAALSSKENK